MQVKRREKEQRDFYARKDDGNDDNDDDNRIVIAELWSCGQRGRCFRCESFQIISL